MNEIENIWLVLSRGGCQLKIPAILLFVSKEKDLENTEIREGGEKNKIKMIKFVSNVFFFSLC